MIGDASAVVAGGRALVLGAGRCQEIPVDTLAERFERLVLNDHDESLLATALAALGLNQEKTRVETIIADLTGVTGAFLSEIDTILANSSLSTKMRRRG